MGFEFNNQPNSWYTPQVNFDATSGSEWGAMNLHMNQAYEDSIARQSLYMTPIYNFSNFNQYVGPFGTAVHDEIFKYTMGQLHFQNLQNGGPGWFDTDGNFQAPWLNPSSMTGIGSGMGMGNPWGNLGWNPPVGNAGNNGGKNPPVETERERDFRRKFKTLTSLTNQLVANSSLSAKQKDDLRDEALAATRMKGTWEEKFNKLNEVYKKIDKETIKEFLAQEAHNLGATEALNAKKDNSFYEELTNVGFEREETDSRINTLYDDITKLNDKQGNLSTNPILGLLDSERMGTGDTIILDVISSYKSEKGSNIISDIKKSYDKIKDKEQRNSAKDTAIKPLVETLTKKARQVMVNLDSDAKELIDKTIKDLEKDLNNVKETVPQSLAVNFEKLYLLTRVAAITELTNNIVAYYGEIDPQLFNKDMFSKETKEDLIQEGFSETDVNNAFNNIKINPKKEAKIEETPKTESKDPENVKEEEEKQEEVKVDPSLDEKEIEAQKEELTKEALKSLDQKVTIDGVEYEVFVETKGEKLYIIKDNKIYELTNAKLIDGKITTNFTEGKSNLKETKASEIKAEHDKKVQAEKKAKEAEKKAQEADAKAKKEVKEALEYLEENGYLKKTTIIYKDGYEEEAYIETRPTGDREICRYVSISNDGKRIVIYNDETKKWESIKDPKSYFEKEFAKMSKVEIDDAKKIGGKLEDHLVRITLDSDWEEINEQLLNINSKNVLYVLKGYEDDRLFYGDKFFEEVENEWGHSNDRVNLTQKMVEYVIEYIKTESANLSEEKQKKASEELAKLEAIEINENTDGSQIDTIVNKLFIIFNIK